MKKRRSNMKVKRRAGGVLAVVLLCNLSVPVHASEFRMPPVHLRQTEQMELMSVGASANTDLRISSGKASMSCTAKGRSKVAKVTINMKLQKKKSDGTWYVAYRTSASGNKGYCKLSRTVSVSKGTYRICATVTTQENKVSETRTYYSAIRKY